MSLRVLEGATATTAGLHREQDFCILDFESVTFDLLGGSVPPDRNLLQVAIAMQS